MVEPNNSTYFMEKKYVSKRVTATILSMSLLTVMAGAAIAPALGIIKAHFSEANDLLVQLIVSMPALLIIVTNLFFSDHQPTVTHSCYCYYRTVALCNSRCRMLLYR